MMRRMGWRLCVCAGVVGLVGAPASAKINLELRLASPVVNNGDVVDVDVYAVCSGSDDSLLGRARVVFTWDSDYLELTGHQNGDYAWFSAGFPGDPSPGDGINVPQTAGIPDNDGDAFYRALANPGNVPDVAAAPGQELHVTTLKFLAIDATAAVSIGIESIIGATDTYVDQEVFGGSVITGSLGAPVSVEINCTEGVGTTCDDNNDCTLDACVTTTSCTHTPVTMGSSCGDPSDTDCDNPDSCDAGGNCLSNYELNGVACGDSGDTDCDNPDTCDGAGVCLDNYEPADTGCGDSSDTECDNPDTCDGSGVCESNYEPALTACGDAGDTDCDDPDTCDGGGACAPNHTASGTACTPDANECTDDECDGSGACGHPDSAPGTPCGDPTINPCTDADTCDGSGVCDPNDFDGCFPPTPYCRVVLNPPDPPTHVCVECLEPEHCDDEEECTQDWCSSEGYCFNSTSGLNGQPCTSDGLFCNGIEECLAGDCVHPGNPCDDEEPCTDDQCTEPDQCDFVPNDANDCSDGEFCLNGLEYCQSGVCITPGAPDCDDDNECTSDWCDAELDECATEDVPNLSGCQDGEPCTINDYCINGVCISGVGGMGNGDVNLVWAPAFTQVVVDDQFEVGLYAVSTTGGNVEFFAIDVILEWNSDKLDLVGINNNGPYAWLTSSFPCDAAKDSLNTMQASGFDYECCKPYPSCCNGGGGGPCAQPQYPGLSDNDGDAYWVALADTFTGDPPFATPAGLLLTSFVFEGIEAVAGTDVDVADCVGDSPTTTSVDGGTAGLLQGDLGSTLVEVVDCTIDDDCDDGDFCNGEERCVGTNCVAGTDPCDDDVDCTIDSCNEGGDSCTNAPDDDFCDNGDYCDGEESCHATLGCRAGTAINCDDTDACTQDYCDEGDDMCKNDSIPNCQPCVDAGSCEDLIPCTDDICDDANPEGQMVCRFEANDDFCDDELFCTGAETCDPDDPGADGDGCVQGDVPCDPCSEITGCACTAPLVESVGCRYIAIYPQQGPSTPSAFQVSYCGGSITKYVGTVSPWNVDGDPEIEGTLGLLVDDPADAEYLTPEEWGGVVYVTGEDIVPNTDYDVRGDCGMPGSPSLTEIVPVTYELDSVVYNGTWLWGDCWLDRNVNIDDILATISGFQGSFIGLGGAPTIMPNLDILGTGGCVQPTINQQSNISDILATIEGFQGKSYTCNDPCAP